jgi:hypothetical protein
MIAIKKHIYLAIFYFLLVALLGVLLRLFWVADVPATFKFMVHTHSHIALLGWVYVGLSSLVYFIFLKAAVPKKLYTRIFWFTQFCIVGMLLSFPFQGYALFSILFSTLFLFATYFFSWMVFRYTPKPLKARNSYKLLRASLIYLILSSIGPWALGAIMGTLGSTSIWYKNAIYFYLHFQYNAWFMLALMSFFFYMLEEKAAGPSEQQFRIFNYSLHTGIILSFFLSVLWIEPAGIFYNLAGIGAVVQVFAFWMLFKIFKPALPIMDFGKMEMLLIKISAALLGLKIFMQLLSALPYFAKLAYSSIDFVIGYLHLTFLGPVSLLLLVCFSRFKLLKLDRLSLSIYLLAFLLTEGIIFFRGMAIWQRWDQPEDLALYLLIASSLFPLAILSLFLKNLFRRN